MECKGRVIELPRFEHVKRTDWDYVYEPSEDSFLMLDALEKDLDYIELLNPQTVLEVGSGSGVVITALSKCLRSSSFCMAVDVNEYACRVTKSTSQHNNCSVDVIRGDLTSCLKQQTVDLILFNPPYVVTPDEEVFSKDPLTKSWAGGINGTLVINRFLKTVTSVLSETGFGYLLVIKENDPNDIMAKLREYNCDCEVVAERKIRGEELFILKFVRKTSIVHLPS